MAGDKMFFQRDDQFYTLDSFHMVLLDIPLKVCSDAKEPYKNDWPDEHGDEEYDVGTFQQAYELEVTFGHRCTLYNTAVLELRSFVSWLQAGEFMFWSEHGNFGRRHVRYVGYEDDATLWNGHLRSSSGQTIGEWILRFKLKFKVNDPVTMVIPNSTNTGLRILGS